MIFEKLVPNPKQSEIRNLLPWTKEYKDKIDVISCTVGQIDDIVNLLNIQFPVYSILYFRALPNTEGLVHKDEILNSDNLNVAKFALNIPVLNSLNMSWFEPKIDNPPVLEFPGPTYGDQTPLIKKEYVNQIASTDIDSPTLVSINQWHNVKNTSPDQIGEIISIRFEPAIELDLFLEYAGHLLQKNQNS